MAFLFLPLTLPLERIRYVHAAAEAAVPLRDGIYENALTGAPVTVAAGKLFCDGRPVILFAPISASAARSL